ncbi:LlaJI family restriction endonuclease [Hoylesella loescheii]|uniref:LlaJI family restriction endonuclease n=1 Tax=Hoylesella loescheii TaxID=840 RepID=UPI00248ECE40|nr:LlaJI family restriction endonuclease [Hoylesella loescheii]
MRILIEEHSYQATEDILNVVSELGPTIGVGGKVSIGYVGYYYNANIQDCVFILPKVLLDEQGRAFQKYNPEDIIHLENRNNPLNEEERHFVYELSVWIYRAISVFKERNKDTQIVLHERVAQIGHGQHRMSNTFLDILLSLIQFYQDNQDFFFFTIKNLHSGHNKINWTKTIAHSQAYIQDNSPVYLNPTNKRRQVNFDEELMVIYFSILNYIHREYGFPFETECHYDTISNQQFASYLKGMGKARLQQIRYKYFSDKALELWNLCFAFFDEARQIVVNTKQREYLLVKSFEIVFEDIIDELIGSKNNELPTELKDQADGKQVDHIYRYKALTETSTDNIYYIGDSKYYKRNTRIGKEALYKQFTYARNVVQWNLNLFLDDNRRAEQKVELQAGTGMLRDETTEGYNIIPNFFISAQQRDLEMHSDITWVDRENKDFTSRQFHNRLFDRDTLLVCHYNVNFLYVVALYGRKNEGMKAAWREKVRAQFRKEIQSMLDSHFQFHIMTPRKYVNGEEVLRQNFKQVLGKVFKPYPNAVNEQCFYSLALEKPETIKDEKQRAATIEENQNIKQLLGEHFEILECKIGEDRRNELTTPTPEAQCGISNKDLVLLITKEGVHFDKNIQLLETTKRIGIALKMDGAVLQLVEGFTKASILIIHNKSNKHHAYRLAEKGPHLVPASGAPEMVVTKQGEDLYLVYDVDLTEGQPPLDLGELNLKPITKGGDSYSPHLLPLSRLLT